MFHEEHLGWQFVARRIYIYLFDLMKLAFPTFEIREPSERNAQFLHSLSRIVEIKGNIFAADPINTSRYL